jgi:nitrate reductase / nitrite oxidoreductase, alpha subunit
MAERHLGTRTDIVAGSLNHDTPEELAQPLGEVRDWRRGECEPVPGKTMPKLVAVERDYPAVAAKMRALGPLVEKLGVGAKGVTFKPDQEVDELRRRNGTVREGPGAGRPSLARDVHVAEAILALSGTTNGRLAMESFRALEEHVGRPLAHIAAERVDERLTLGEITTQPRKVIASAEWSGLESRERRYSPFTQNVDHLIPWRTLTGRQQLYVDHEWMLELGEALPAYRPPVDAGQLLGLAGEPAAEEAVEVTVRYLTPHSKWSIHSEFQDNLHMLTLFRGGPAMWLSVEDAERIGVRDNDWLEVYNRHGAVSCRAAVSHRVPPGVALYYHSQDRHVNVGISEISGARGGTDNSLTRISMKPTHLIGGYAQLSWGFNYYGACGPQRDQLIIIRKRRTEVEY